MTLFVTWRTRFDTRKPQRYRFKVASSRSSCVAPDVSRMMRRGFSLVNPKTYKQLKFHDIIPKRGYMKHTLMLALLLLVSCGKGGSGGSGTASDAPSEVIYKLKQALNPVVTGDESIILEATCQEEHSCEVSGMIYGNDSGPLPMLKMNFTATLTWDGTHYSGVIQPVRSCAFVYELKLNETSAVLTYDGRTKNFNSLQSFTNAIADEYQIVATAQQNCVDAR